MASLALGWMIQLQNMNNLGAEKQLPCSLDRGAKAVTPPGPEWQCYTAAVCATVHFNTVCAFLFNHAEIGANSGGSISVFHVKIQYIFQVNVSHAQSDNANMLMLAGNIYHSQCLDLTCYTVHYYCF